MTKEKENRTSTEILDDIIELMGLINIDGAWYTDMETYHEMQALKVQREARRAKLTSTQNPPKTT
jgi:hypothetical protein